MDRMEQNVAKLSKLFADTASKANNGDLTDPDAVKALDSMIEVFKDQLEVMVEERNRMFGEHYGYINYFGVLVQ